MFGKKKSEDKTTPPEPKKAGIIRKSARWAFKPFVNVSEWAGFDIIKNSSNYLITSIRRLFSLDIARHNETFEEALQRLNIKEKDLSNKVRDMTRLATLYLIMCLAILAYAAYLAFQKEFLLFLTTLVIAMVAAGCAFRFHFWVFQIKNRRLGCTMKEWYDANLKGEKND